ncbi:hypothetical protein Fleli_1848 [Bernardetia litoralis DSM 6794]|uniref:DUF4365 domain-containing protein n=1 Tax=Bernardetia litoralis (strain ATCC 23117 / DSM 6794 / NBRC 15988 / NCIMB 1366 / Fx l1 / Sio-4) TaxID=880071 RepID=I4AJW1_BERLS|nr:DUF4365 domain-containing protein [Bernardetia litoralis]AFM04246.1 hypothetical protein Fleli_1848 [Bernardetia litoralis DSM 6794]
MRVNLNERLGVLEANIIFTKNLKWIFREQPLVDVGIDALVEEVIEASPTGKFLAVQIKGGKGNVYETETTYNHYVSNVHQQYWLNLSIPIIIAVYIPENELVYWEFVSDDTLVKTEKRWKIEIPKNKILNETSVEELRQIIKSNLQSDFLSQFLNGNVSDEEVDKILNSMDHLTELAETVTQVNNTMAEMTLGITKNTNKFNHYISKGFTDENREVQNSINDLATVLNKSSRRFNELIDNFSNEFADVFGGFQKMAIIYFYHTKNYKSLEKIYESMDDLNKSIKDSTDFLIKLRNQSSALPTKYNNLANSRIRIIDAINRLIEEFKISNEMANKFTKWLYEKVY